MGSGVIFLTYIVSSKTLSSTICFPQTLMEDLGEKTEMFVAIRNEEFQGTALQDYNWL